MVLNYVFKEVFTMKMSKFALVTYKDRISSDECLSLRILLQSGLLYRFGGGIYGQHNFLVRAQEKIKSIIRETLDSYDCVEISLPALQPKHIWEESGRWEKYANSDQMFICEMSNGTFCLAPTAEEAVFTFARNSLRSYKDLPVNLYQINQKFRNEIRVRGGLLRSKEFTMMDAYSFHSSEASLIEEYANMKKAYYEIFSKIGLNVIPVAAVNGDMGGKLSEEFMFISEAGEDMMLVDETGTIGLNTEILEIENSNEYLKSNYEIDDISTLSKKNCIELGHIFQLGQRYSVAMNGKFMDENNNSVPYYMGCYGIGVSRTLAAICEQNCDEIGLIWPKNLAPYSVYIAYHKEKSNEALELYEILRKANIDVLIDDRNLSLGAKIKDSKLLGVPYLVIIGGKFDGKNYEIEERVNSCKYFVTIEKLVDIVK